MSRSDHIIKGEVRSRLLHGRAPHADMVSTYATQISRYGFSGTQLCCVDTCSIERADPRITYSSYHNDCTNLGDYYYTIWLTT